VPLPEVVMTLSFHWGTGDKLLMDATHYVAIVKDILSIKNLLKQQI
jgi:hypothetical protein